MAKKFVRSITGIKNIQDQDLSTNNVGDLLSDGKDIYVHRKNGNKEEYFNLTEEKKNPTDIKAPDGKGLTAWKDGDTTNVSLSEEFLTNNAQYISSSDNSIVATPTQSKYGKNYDLKLSKELQDTIKNNTGGKSKPIKVKPAPTPINADDPVDVLTVKETNDSITLGVTNNVLTGYNLRGKDVSVTVEETSWDDLDENFMDVKREGWAIRLDPRYWLRRNNFKTVKGSGILLKEETDLAGLKLDTEFATLDIDSTKLLRHDCLLGDEAKGIKVWHTDGKPTSSISLTDDVWQKLAKVDQLTSAEPVTPTTVSNTDGNLTVTTKNNNAEVNFSDTAKAKLATVDTLATEVDNLKASSVSPAYQGDGDSIVITTNLDNNKIISLNGGMKNKIKKIDGIDSRLTQLEENDPSVGAGTQKTIISSDGSVTIGTTENNVDLSVDLSVVNSSIDNKINNKMTAKLDDIHTLIEGTTVEEPLTKSYNQTPKGRTVNLGLNEQSKKRLEKVDTIESNVNELTEKVTGLNPVFKRQTVKSVAGHISAQLTYMAVPYGESNYIGTVSIIIDATHEYSEIIPLAKTNEFNKILSTLNFPENHGSMQSGGVNISKNDDGSININTDAKFVASCSKLVAQFPVVTSKM